MAERKMTIAWKKSDLAPASTRWAEHIERIRAVGVYTNGYGNPARIRFSIAIEPDQGATPAQTIMDQITMAERSGNAVVRGIVDESLGRVEAIHPYALEIATIVPTKAVRVLSALPGVTSVSAPKYILG
jgi:hypothetical protein